MRIRLYSCGACGQAFDVSGNVVGRLSMRGLTELRRAARIGHAEVCRGVRYCHTHPTHAVLPNATEGLRPWCTAGHVAGHVAGLPAVRELAPAGDRITELLTAEVTC